VKFLRGNELIYTDVNFVGPNGSLEGAGMPNDATGSVESSEGGPVPGRFTCQITQVDSYAKKSGSVSAFGTNLPPPRRIGGAGPVVTGKT